MWKFSSSMLSFPFQSYCKYLYPILGCIIGVIILITAIYIPYNNTYLIDEYYDGDALREMTLQDKLTIRVSCHDTSKEQLKKFVEHYSMCPSVYEIKIIHSDNQEGYKDIKYIYEHTHSLVNYISKSSESSINWETESILLLDPHVFVSCSDLKFTFSVWKSSYDSLVGYFPRLHTSTQVRNDSSGSPIPPAFQYLDWFYVVWHQRYSLMLPTGVILKKDIWESYLGSSKEAVGLQRLISLHPECSPVGLSLWSAHTSPSPPIWVDIPLEIDDFTSHASLNQKATAPTSLRLEETKKIPDSTTFSMSECLAEISSLLHSPQLSYSFHKATPAKNLLFW